MKKVFILCLFLSMQVFAFDFSSAASMFGIGSAQEKEVAKPSTSLLSSITSELGVTNTQATAGTTAILSKAASNMSSSDVSALTSAVPALSSFMGGNSVVGGLLSSSLDSQFSSLGMDTSMISKFMPIILNYINSEAGAGMMKTVQSALLQ